VSAYRLKQGAALSVVVALAVIGWANLLLATRASGTLVTHAEMETGEPTKVEIRR
jgi:hypothetical protein